MKDMASNRFLNSVLFSSWSPRLQGFAFCILLVACSLIPSGSVHATNITWIGGNGAGGNGGYDVAIDWNPNQVPASVTLLFSTTRPAFSTQPA